VDLAATFTSYSARISALRSFENANVVSPPSLPGIKRIAFHTISILHAQLTDKKSLCLACAGQRLSIPVHRETKLSLEVLTSAGD
jgi:hypothetical protein